MAMAPKIFKPKPETIDCFETLARHQLVHSQWKVKGNQNKDGGSSKLTWKKHQHMVYFSSKLSSFLVLTFFVIYCAVV